MESDSIEEQRRSKLSKFLTLILRHQPEILGLNLDNEGFLSCSITDLALKIAEQKDRLDWVTVEDIKAVVDTDPKGRYEISDNSIRATYGHSIKLNPLEFPDDVEDLPEFVYYAGNNHEVGTMLRLGLIASDRRDRNYLHLSVNIKDAYSVAKNYTRYPKLIRITIHDAANSNIKFKKVSPFIVISEEVPPQFLEEIDLPEDLKYLINERPQRFQKYDKKPFRKPHGSRPSDKRPDNKKFSSDNKFKRNKPNNYEKKPFSKPKPVKETPDESTFNNDDLDDDTPSQFTDVDDIKKKAKSKSTIHFEVDDEFDMNS